MKVSLHVYLLTRRVSSAAAERNIRFLRDHAPGSLGVGAFEKRSTTDVIPDEADVEDGDMLCILRLDGLDPLINWGTRRGVKKVPKASPLSQ